MFEAKCCRTSSHSQEIVVTLPVSPRNGQIHSGQNYVRQENCCFLRKNKIHEYLRVKCWGEWWCGKLYWLGVEATGGWWWPQQQPTAGVTVPASGSMSFSFLFLFSHKPHVLFRVSPLSWRLLCLPSQELERVVHTVPSGSIQIKVTSRLELLNTNIYIM